MHILELDPEKHNLRKHNPRNLGMAKVFSRKKKTGYAKISKCRPSTRPHKTRTSLGMTKVKV